MIINNQGLRRRYFYVTGKKAIHAPLKVERKRGAEGMYIGYTNRCIYVENRKKKHRKGIAIFTILALLGCVTMNVIAWEGSARADAVTVEGEPVWQESPTVSAGDVEAAFEKVPEEAVDEKNVVVIDPGHGGEDMGCSNGDILEKDINLQIALALRDQLYDMGYEVIMTREDDTFLTLEERVALVNGSGADILVSIHQNAYEEKTATGIETWYCGAISEGAEVGMTATNYRSEELGNDSKRLAKLLYKDLILYTDAVGRESRETEGLKLIREVQIPASLVETGFLSNQEECEKLTDPTYQERIVEGLASGIDLYFYPKTMYLTFDDGPTAENTNAILDILKEKNIKATFFVVGENVKKNPEVAQRIVEEGHTIGIHCNQHDYDVLYESVDSYLADFEEAYNIVYEVTGVEVKLFRFPGGSINAYNKDISEEIIAAMTERGFIYFDWNASLEDATKNNDPEVLLKNAVESTLGRKKIVMLAHDIIYNTTLCLEELIEQFPEYRMEPLTPEVEPIQF